MLPWHWVRRKTATSWEVSDHLTIGNETVQNVKIEASPILLAALGAAVMAAISWGGVRMSPAMLRFLGFSPDIAAPPHPVEENVASF